MADATGPALVFVEHVLWNPTPSWQAAVTHLAARFERSHPLDPDVAVGDLAGSVRRLGEWAAAAQVDLDRELGRWFDEHLSMHVRPDPTVTRALRALAAERPVIAVSALPPRPAESILRHAGAWRSISELAGDVVGAARLEEVAARSAATLLLAPIETTRDTHLPPHLEVRVDLGSPESRGGTRA